MKKLPVILLFAWLLLAISLSAQEANRPKSQEGVSLEDLGVELLKPLNRESTAPSADRLLEQPSEAIGARSAAHEDWLSKVVAPMQAAQALLERRDSSERASVAQTEALTGINVVIAELTRRRSQCQGGQPKQLGKPKPGQKSGSQSKSGNSPAKGAPATTSNARVSIDLVVARKLMKDLWGKLPERQRQQMLQPLREDFLPKYASEIEAYFRALANPHRTVLEPQ